MQGNSTIAYIYDPSLSKYDYGDDHPMKTQRSLMTTDLLKASGLLEHCSLYVS